MTTGQAPDIPPPSPQDVLYERLDGFARITLNRPVVLNAINWSIQRRLMWALEQAERDDEVRAVVLTGAGRAFSAGGDLQSGEPEDGEPVPGEMEIFMRIWGMPKPVIAAVRGYAVGLGCQLAGICDITIAAEDARLGEVQIRHGFGPPVLILPYLIGLKQAKELLMTGEMVTAADAVRIGLVNRVVPADRVLDEAEAMARRIAALPAETVGTNKLLVNRVHELAGLHQALDYRSDPLFAHLRGESVPAGETNEHLRVLHERGWEAFRQSRDAGYRST